MDGDSKITEALLLYCPGNCLLSVPRPVLPTHFLGALFSLAAIWCPLLASAVTAREKAESCRPGI